MKQDYYKTRETVKEYIKAAEGFNGRELIDELKKYLPQDASLLELGTGPGTDWQILNDFYKVTGSDNSQEFLNHLNASIPNGEFIELDASELKTDLKFDGIYSNKVLHHLSDSELENSIQQQAEILNQNGIICHSFWKGEGSEIFKGLFVNYHTTSSLRKLFNSHFEILLLNEYEEFETDDSILIIAKKR